MNKNELTALIEKELTNEGITEELLINRYGSIANWSNSIIKIMQTLN